MRLTARDIHLIRDLSLSHVLSRDQIIALRYFSSVTRTNTRLRELANLGFVRRLRTAFHAQGLYTAEKLAAEVVGDQIASLLHHRASSPQFLIHALRVTDIRLALAAKKDGEWRFEQQLWRRIEGKPIHEIRPDGLFLGQFPIFIECDLGHVSSAKFSQKLAAYKALTASGQCNRFYGFSEFKVLTVTTGSLRSRHLAKLLPANPGFGFMVQTFADLGIAPIETWS